MTYRTKRRKYDPLKVFLAVFAAVALLTLIAFLVITVADRLNEIDTQSVTSLPSSTDASVDTSSVISVTSEVSPEPSSEPDSSVSSSSAVSTSSSKTVSTHRLSNGDYIEYTKDGADELSEWYLKLANKWNPVGESFVPAELKTVNSDGRQVDARIYGAYKDMVAASKKDGVSLYAISTYRSYSKQQQLFNNNVAKQKNRDSSLTQAQAEEKASMSVAIPGTSEHQLGLAVDFNSVEQDFEDTKEGKWLYAHCTDYGFIMRYPSDKTDITGIIYEPWHFRFVGIKHAKRMEELGMCLEEYIDYLKNLE